MDLLVYETMNAQKLRKNDISVDYKLRYMKDLDAIKVMGTLQMTTVALLFVTEWQIKKTKWWRLATVVHHCNPVH